MSKSKKGMSGNKFISAVTRKTDGSTHRRNGNKRHVRLGLSSEVSEPAPSPGKVTGSVTSVSGGG